MTFTKADILVRQRSYVRKSYSVSEEFEEKKSKVIAKIVKWERYQASLEEMFTINLKNKDLERSPAIRDCIEQAKRSGIIALTSSVTAPDELSALLATIRLTLIET